MTVTPIRQDKIRFMTRDTLEKKWGDFYDENPEVSDYLTRREMPQTRAESLKLFEEIRQANRLQTDTEKLGQAFGQVMAVGLYPIVMGLSTFSDVLYGDRNTTTNMQRLFERFAMPNKEYTKKLITKNAAHWRVRNDFKPTGA